MVVSPEPFSNIQQPPIINDLPISLNKAMKSQTNKALAATVSWTPAPPSHVLPTLKVAPFNGSACLGQPQKRRGKNQDFSRVMAY